MGRFVPLVIREAVHASAQSWERVMEGNASPSRSTMAKCVAMAGFAAVAPAANLGNAAERAVRVSHVGQDARSKAWLTQPERRKLPVGAWSVIPV